VPVLDLLDDAVFSEEKENLPGINAASDLVYCIYTSGTSGTPKGVLLEHRNAVRMLLCADYARLGEDTVFLQMVSMAFDPAVLEIWGTLLHGGTLCLVEQHVLTSPDLLQTAINNYSINSMLIAASLYNQLIDVNEALFDRLQLLIIGGEKISEQHVRKLLARQTGVQIVNAYGPTENSTTSTTYIVREPFLSIPIGKPIGNTQIYILQNQNLCGVGMPGELCIAGDGLARGYLNLPTLTAEKFIDNPFGSGKLYRSGDLARWLSDGNIDYLGRMDHQVKIRGFRIELGEIENALRQLPQFSDAAVIVKTDALREKTLCAFVVSEEEPDFAQIKRILRERLPDYMIPMHFMRIEKVPVTANGKLDTRALPTIEMKSERDYIPAQNEKEQALLKVFSEVLGIERLGARDNFFELGGDSIKAIRVISKLRESGYEFNVRDLMMLRTVEALGEKINKSAANTLYEQGEIAGQSPLTPVQKSFFAWQLQEPHYFNQSVLLVSSETLREETLRAAFKAIAEHHDMLRAVYRDGAQIILPASESKLFELTFFNLSESSEIEIQCNKIQSSMDLANGPLLKAAVFQREGQTQLFVCLHHLIVDGVSWRIVLEDLQTAYWQAFRAQSVQLPPKTASYRQWAEATEAYGKSIDESEIDYWRKTAEKAVQNDFRVISKTSGGRQNSVEMQLSPEDTKQLLYEAGRAYETEINDLLLCALSLAVKELTGQSKIAVLLESHGRINEAIDLKIDRTVGWFTSMYPVVLETGELPQDSILATKETLRSVPNKGMGYSALKYGFGESLPLAGNDLAISFNYLGHITDSSMQGQSFIMANQTVGRDFSERNVLQNAITLSGKVTGGQLRFTAFYNENGDKSARRLLELYKEKLIQITQHCCSQKEKEKTVADFGLSAMAVQEISALNELIGDLF
jgi:amino acid adenylation domain-containing protein/non-ribosomal peptide synthase protein (TIGR01720 family)